MDFCGSMTVPEMLPVTVCAATLPAVRTTAISAIPNAARFRVRDLDMDPPRRTPNRSRPGRPRRWADLTLPGPESPPNSALSETFHNAKFLTPARSLRLRHSLQQRNRPLLKRLSDWWATRARPDISLCATLPQHNSQLPTSNSQRKRSDD